MIPLELFIGLYVIAAVLFAAHLYYIGAESMFDILFGIISSIMQIVLTVLFAAGGVGLAAASGSSHTLIAIHSVPVVFLLIILAVMTLISALYRAAQKLTTTYRGGY